MNLQLRVLKDVIISLMCRYATLQNIISFEVNEFQSTFQYFKALESVHCLGWDTLSYLTEC